MQMNICAENRKPRTIFFNRETTVEFYLYKIASSFSSGAFHFKK
jgi:hypothetical protein